MSKSSKYIIYAVIALFVLLPLFGYVVDETKQAIVLRLGQPVGDIKKPGLHVRIPILHQVEFFEKRLMDYDAAPAEILTSDKKNLVVDNYAKWRIIDPLLFYKTVTHVRGALARLDDIIYSEVRNELGKHLFIDIITKVRSEIMARVTLRSDEKARQYGIEVLDVRIKRADLPVENERAVFGRMRAERERQAKKYRSEGEEASIKLKASAERERTILLAEAKRKAEILMGDGDAEAARIYAEAYSQDPEFYDFTRSLEAYVTSLTSDTVLVLSEKDEFIKYLQSSEVR